MKAVRVTSWGSPPEYITVPDLPPPEPTQLQLRILAAGVPRVTRFRAAKDHPSAYNATLPFDPGVDGVGLDETTGTRYFIHAFAAPIYAERANVLRSQLVQLDANIDPVSLAGLANPATSSWMALKYRAIGGCKGLTVAIVGATSASGRLAALIARTLGATRVIGFSRNADTLATVEGLDTRVILKEPLVLPDDLGPVHIVLDYVGGPNGVSLMEAVEIDPGKDLQYILTGGLAGHKDVHLPAQLINKRPIRIMASGIGSFSGEDLKREQSALVAAVAMIKPPFDLFPTSLEDFPAAWSSGDKAKKLVVTP
ncbi:uncharacterized protein N7484_011604 [Penicillium longicatenatum]|uniref:uncharacterized protein n=1 Tax=Penicillium longicatenatum TaxID=1561947 RepID=UPI00254692F0|nr:uncharacterized protein N7484_011604 [Penicillium longicatenatum]KAJ5631504.1 hypothetical protein N7484_011604 [Penicillium longicatenatum]